ncbi:MAG: hypothetical protein A3F69_06810 [Acidobacteria bacterium RIFCSPLOWO2_12_FULL_66_10]|nr:MAG: hypothetical protein A3F69_06810 [Acidobacteria bacterium RIFCSPLOWO2_12_FULL_66_10]
MSGDHLTATMLERPSAFGLSLSVVRWAAIAGAVTGIAYAFSPLTVIVALATVPFVRWAGRDVTGVERQWLFTLLAVAIAFRVIAIAALFLTANPDAGTFAKFFGDEEFYQLRGLRLYNIWMGIPISQESFAYAYDKTGYTSYQEILIFLHVLFGPMPYGIHLLNAALFLTGIVLLYRLVRVSFGPMPALVGFAYLLFLPSLFMWSVSALKESSYLLLTSIVLVSTMATARSESLVARAAALIVVIGVGSWLETLRAGGRVITLGGAALGYALRIVSLRRWAMALACGLALAVIAVVWQRGLPAPVQNQLHASARYHRGHVFTPGHSYKLLDQRFYSTAWAPLAFPAMTAAETARYLVRAPIHFVVEPIPWRVASRLELAYLPELVVWYVAVLLVPFGLVAGFRRDALLTCVLAGYSFISAGIIALNSGNIGTLVRHRALVAPYLGWISALGFVSLLSLARRSERSTPS